MNTNVKHRWNEWSETWYPIYRTEEVIASIVRHPESAFHPTTCAMLQQACPSLEGKRICVPSSGDNHAVFASHLMGASVSSVDISERQLENSAAIAVRHGWDIRFICDDTMTLGQLNSAEYDLVYTSNGVHVWISDLTAMYSSIHRILKEGGTYLMSDVHPFNRPFGKANETPAIVKPYDASGPIVIDDVPLYHWRMQDLMNAMIASGLHLHQIEEMYAEDGSFWIDDSIQDKSAFSAEELQALADWRTNPMAALPQWLSIKAVK
ncbi:class I SAM-dependent methyltransferase [Paenibacillus sp. PR3]|uniref:Class I SAM-dependent methyltransferase n=1 Tax=Paenibacillus terricola TaxID=2763503 RepID=A0ABR8MXR8_9BACL|nr:class I SAM-dependent methyltransferase [Paenibacillus terricola]MBD3919836.1 class I SAM-dependent methyltransferase [Paenibacillus terricola]